MATHSSILGWRIPRTDESDGLQSMESQSQIQLSNRLFTFHFSRMLTHAPEINTTPIPKDSL